MKLSLRYKGLTRKEIRAFRITRGNVIFELWYEALQCYMDAIGGDINRSLATDLGEAFWRERYESGEEVPEAYEYTMRHVWMPE
ncbi:MAG: hypothetical protein CVV47_07200 [Spirochaetae bacterium HGW-Spirochaetae-3]|jgi:hypothetical protein|nr:MAG: hypothetical protein CVV47_07200 [Spirochaetae bacterium HGW-Spirochaetae-3]